jgi:BspA type Leucine rich repeat region (6 copies)/SprB repeat/Secretion system C-terminal sorting domain
LLSFGYTFSYGGILYSQNGATTVQVASQGGTFVGAANIYDEVYDGFNWYSVINIGISAFQNCTGLTSVTMPNSIISIDAQAFYNCSGLTSVNIPNSVTSIGNYSFNSCSGLTSVTGMTSVTNIGSHSFDSCTNLSSIAFSSSITSIGRNAFSFCTSLSSLAGLSALTNVDISTFLSCTSLSSLNGLTSITTIGDYAFLDCTGLISANIPNSVTSIGDQAFKNCTALTSLSISNSLTTVNSAFQNCSALSSVIIPNSVQYIYPNAFESCTSLASLTLSNSLLIIFSGAFANCNNLSSLIIPNSVTTIGSGAFLSCSSLVSVTIPNSVTSIAGYAFANCTSLNSVTVNWGTPLTNVNISSFVGVTLANVKLYVPAGTAAAYDAVAVWTDFNIISPLTATQSQTNATCNDGANGTATVVPSGGIAPYDYLWSNGWTLSGSASNLYADNYSCTITDAAMNSININFVITAPDSIEIIPTQTDVSCFGGSNGTATVSASGGTGSFTYLWTPNGGNGATATGLIAGDYFCKVTDANGCNKYQGFTITEPNEIFLSGYQADVSCFGGANGSADVTPFNGTPPYTYLWNNGATSQSINSLSAGNYNVVVTDNNGCTKSQSYVITQPNELTITGSQNNVPCSGSTIDTFATVTPSGGTAPYTYVWSNGASSQTISEIAAGSYFVTVYDSNGCSAFRNFAITLDATPLPTRNGINGTLCEPSTYATLASKFDNESTIKIYASATSTTPLNPQDVIAPIGTNVSYYITQTLNGCESPRLAYSAFVNTLPTPTAVDQAFCGSGFEVNNLVATLSQNASSLKWYDVPTGGTALSSTFPLVSGNYYVTQNKYPCGESTRKMITVTISLPTDNVTPISACDSYTWNGTTYSETGIYVGTTNNCVIEKLNLTISPSYFNNTTRFACGSYTWANNNQTYTESGTYYGTTTNCGTEKLNLTITPIPVADAPVNVTNCLSYILPALSPGNKYFSESNGQGIEYVVGANDGITQTSTIYVLARSPFFPFCQSENSFTVTIIPNNGTNTTTNACGSYIWGVNGETYSTSGNYEYVSGCNTSYLNLTINPVITNLTTKTECNSYFWPSNGTTYNETGTYSFNVGCETFTLNLTITPSSDDITTATACDSYIWNGTTYNQSGLYVGTTTNCVTEKLDLTITPSTTLIQANQACVSYNWPANGETYTESGSYTAVNGCQTTIMNLTINQPVTVNITETACDSYFWSRNDATYTTSGTYTFVSGCLTSILNLTITPSTNNTTTVSAVGNYIWPVNGETLSTTLIGYEFPNGNCNTEILNLTIIPATITITNENGVLNAITNAPNATYQWYNCISEQIIAGQTNATFTPTQSGSYNVIIRINGILSGSAGCFNYTFLANNTFSGIAGIDLYPNPSNGIINLKLPIDLQVEIYNNLGQMLSSEKMISGSNVINISDKAAGIYFLKANDGNNVSTFKIIKN